MILGLLDFAANIEEKLSEVFVFIRFDLNFLQLVFNILLRFITVAENIFLSKASIFVILFLSSHHI